MMDLDDLARRLDFSRNDDFSTSPIRVLTPDGDLLEVLSLNWDKRSLCWVLCTEPVDEP